MAFGSSIMSSLFGQKPTEQITPGNIPMASSVQTTPGNPTAPVVPETQTEVSPLDQYKDLWQTDTTKQTTPEAWNKNLTPEAFAAAAKNNDFTKVITPEMQAAISKGGADAQQAVMQMMNAVAQKGFGDSAVATTRIVEQALAKQQERFMSELPNIIKGQTLQDTLRTNNPIFTNPATAPMLQMMTGQVAAKYPNMPAAEQAKLAQQYVLDFANAVNPQKSTQAPGSKPQDDWSKFMPELFD